MRLCQYKVSPDTNRICADGILAEDVTDGAGSGATVDARDEDDDSDQR